ncbi:extracellular solute-binding protein [Paenibacillus sp. WQ 127069]|uniref:Extracellular solute-binding protein n=1 Tax=Paenibacillus baimaensis TaxID=2982185 RepID=A0ABT2UEM5_9BACL|nr:extracellular solute-binding protein [Paenibacillus sp. WQ 127069]MCU6793057.1 extracellular solute-binding protein [Paenibacillus sp. WQ 127069]
MKFRKKKFTTILVILLIVVISLSGCGKALPGNETGPAGKIKLTFGHFKVSESKGDQLFRQTLEAFRKEHPEIDLVEEAIAHDPYRIKMTTLGASGELPDLFIANGSMLIDYIPKGYAGTFNEALDKDPQWKNSFLPNSFDEFNTNGNIYGVPIQMFSVHVIYYNKDIFDKVGITSFPQTWDEFLAAIKKLKNNNYIPITMGNKSNVPVGSTLFGTLADRFTGVDWFKAQKAGTAKFTDPDFVKALATLQDLAKMGAFNPDINSIDGDQANTLYFNKQAAMTINGAWTTAAITENAPDDIKKATLLATLPPVPGGKGDPKAVAGGSGWSLGYNGKLTGEKRDAALAVIKKLSDEAYGKQLIESNGQPAIKVSSYDQNKVSSLGQQYFKFVSDKKYTPIYDIQLSPALVEAIYKGIQDLLIGTVTPEDLAKKIQTVRDSQK